MPDFGKNGRNTTVQNPHRLTDSLIDRYASREIVVPSLHYLYSKVADSAILPTNVGKLHRRTFKLARLFHCRAPLQTAKFGLL
ncbi:hypothetical protein SAMN05660330_01729 [Desulforhopalus singaporensis]|uniref:Uncharacterized protein n=1 Tax=Desulforhopalus singaporensis TaxID=91360 RepID=A0A1H0PRA7_9BACT|nr:hypothetical protein SAMN05660330_01729 [Desulforhopalus singaporensis]